MIREANPGDVSQCIELGLETLARSTYQSEADVLIARRTMSRFLMDKSTLMLVAIHDEKVVGFMMCLKEPHWFSKDKYATDLCFVVSPNHGNYAAPMIRRFIKWAKKDPKVKDIMLGISSGLDQDERTGRMYQNLGFTKVGGTYSLIGAEPCPV